METSGSANIQGHCAEAFEPVCAALSASLADRDVGASVAVFVDGEPVVDLWGGWVDEASGRPWTSDTITCTFSITKTMTALCALVLVDRGLLDLDAPVDRYWPEFAAADKSAVLVRHLLGHTAGLTRWDEPTTMADIYAWEPAVERLAQQPYQWPPGSAAGYHALTFGHLVGEVIRRVSGRTVGEFFADEVAGPLGADIHIGLGAEHDHRVAPSLPDPDRALADLENELLVGVWGPPAYDAATANSLEWRRAQIPAGNAFGNARSVAAVQSVLAGGGEARGVRLLSNATCQRVFEVQADGTDKCLFVPIRYGIGYGLTSSTLPFLADGRTCYWGGRGGSMVVVDLDARMSVAYVMNQMISAARMDDTRAAGIVEAAYEGLRRSPGSTGQP